MVAAYGGRPAAEYFRVDTIARTFSRSNPLGQSSTELISFWVGKRGEKGGIHRDD